MIWLLPLLLFAPPEPSQRAKELMLSGRYREAAAIYTELVRALPEDPGLRLNLALAWQQAGESAKAIPELERVTQQLPKHAAAWMLLGLAWHKQQQPLKAIAPLQRALLLDPANALARFELADAYAASGQPALAVPEFERVTLAKPQDSQAWHGLGLSYLSLSREAFRQLEAAAPRSGYWYASLAKSRADQQQWQSAYALYRQALAQPDHPPGLHTELAAVYRQTGHPDWAEREAAKESGPGCDKDPFYCRWQAQRYQELVSSANTPAGLYWRSRAYGMLASAAWSHIPPGPARHELLASSYRLQGRYADAVEQWRLAQQLAPSDRRIRAELARALAENHSDEEALKLLTELSREEDVPLWHALLGQVLVRRQKPEEALPHLETAARQMAQDLPTRAALGQAYVRLGQPAKALPHLEAALPGDEDGALHYQLGIAYRDLGQLDRARQLFAEQQKMQAQASPTVSEITPP